jgi:cell division septal protein FtsQ
MRSSVSRTFFLVGVPIALGIVGVIFGGMELRRFLITSPKFAVKEVEVVTNGLADRSMILERAAIPTGANLFNLDLEEIRQRIEEEPWVHSATVVRALPNKVQIHYRPQVPQAILGAGSMYYLNQEGVPFYQLKTGDSLQFPLVQVEGKSRDKEIIRQRVEASLQLLSRLKESRLFAEKDLGDITVRVDAEDGAAPFILTLRYPPKLLAGKKGQTDRLYSVSFGAESVDPQVKRWEAVVRYLVQQGKNPRLIRLELGKKVVVKLER